MDPRREGNRKGKGGEVTLQFLFDIVLGILGFVLMGLSKVIWDTLSRLRADMASLSGSVAEIEKKLPETYVRRDDFKAHADRVLQVLDRIEAKLDGKVDKN